MLWNKGEERREPTKVERERKKDNNVTEVKWNDIEREKQTYRKRKKQTGVWVEGQVGTWSKIKTDANEVDRKSSNGENTATKGN